MAFDYDYTGNPALLDRRKVAFFASRVVSPAVEEQALRWAEACCATDRVVISGFQSPLEKSVFELLLKARHPVIGPWGARYTLVIRLKFKLHLQNSAF